MSGASDSAFNMWRCVVAMAHQDGVLDEKEIRAIGEFVQEVEFTDAQRETLREDMMSARSIETFVDKVTEGKDLAVLAHYARIIMFSDGNATPEEQEMVAWLEKHAMDQSGAKDIVAQYKQAYADFETNSDNEIYNSDKSILQKLFLDWMDND